MIKLGIFLSPWLVYCFVASHVEDEADRLDVFLQKCVSKQEEYRIRKVVLNDLSLVSNPHVWIVRSLDEAEGESTYFYVAWSKSGNYLTKLEGKNIFFNFHPLTIKDPNYLNDIFGDLIQKRAPSESEKLRGPRTGYFPEI